MSKQTIAVLGLGAMGARMAKRWLDAGHDVVVYNRTPERAEALKPAGARVAETPHIAAAGAHVVVSMVRDDEAARAVWTHAEAGALPAMAKGAVAIESSTLTPACVRELAEAAGSRGIDWLDAPVAGSRPQADAGQLIYLVGGDAAVLDRVRPLLEITGGAIHHAGPAGSGAALKLAVNALFGIHVAALAEVLALLRKSGMADERAVALLGELPITSPAMKGIGGLIAARKFDPMFPIDLVEKDFAYVEAAARALGADVPTSSAVRGVYARANEQGLGDRNIAGVALAFE